MFYIVILVFPFILFYSFECVFKKKKKILFPISIVVSYLWNNEINEREIEEKRACLLALRTSNGRIRRASIYLV